MIAATFCRRFSLLQNLRKGRTDRRQHFAVEASSMAEMMEQTPLASLGGESDSQAGVEEVVLVHESTNARAATDEQNHLHVIHSMSQI